ncbi:UNVERIFIED_CONTAM: hypothetical protein Sradi_4884700 [Sesamum radiatum]|uniref:Retrotransposon Copia-like N-terminal domain-containing protein n=1 Tax=Sesamum radiatum TaxID=300843 RepID=A0AAW2N1E9_SESRA
MATKDGDNGGKGAASQKLQGDADVFRLQSADHPGMGLVSVPLDGTNYLSWITAIRLL